jgi:DNA repair photolyase
MIKYIVADAGLLNPQAGTVGLEQLRVDLWVAHSDEEVDHLLAASSDYYIRAGHRGCTVGAALKALDAGSTDVLFLMRRRKFISAFTAGAGTTCGEWTPLVGKDKKGFWKASAAMGWCPVRCEFCYLLNIPFLHQGLALNVGEYGRAVGQERRMGQRRSKISVVNLGETGGLVEWCVELNLPELLKAYLDITREAGVTPYILTKKAAPVGSGWSDIDWSGVHVGISLNPLSIMQRVSPGADPPSRLLGFLQRVKEEGASTVIRLGPLMGSWNDYIGLVAMIHAFGLGHGRITVDLMRFSKNHPFRSAFGEGWTFRAHKWQESPDVQRRWFQQVKKVFADATITGCKLDPEYALPWLREGLIKAMPCACWL